MGGKHKQANRTKNNARPSSSSHSAELLGNTIPTFFGFSSIKEGVSVISVEEGNFSIDSDFQIIFKQMKKKDPVTRFKALQSFLDLVNNSDASAVQAILPLWPRMFCVLCSDVDHKVREVSHKAHGAVFVKVKKMMAPYLKEIIGPWFISQYDTYAPAASVAIMEFQKAFPNGKMKQAILFCQDEILSYITDNLINQTPQTLSNPIITSADDMQTKYERTIAASLLGYSLYLQTLSTDQIQEVKEKNKTLLSNPKFWKYSKNKVPIIRSSFFHVLISLSQNAKFLLTEESSRLSTAIFSNLDEPDPVVLHTVWEAALNVLVTIEDCWLHINIEKQVFAKLCPILKAGGRNVSTIYPNILPLLSKLPENSISDKEVFFGDFFDNLKSGLEVNSYSQSISDGKIMATTFIECLKYIIMKNTVDIGFCSSMLSNQLLPALKDKLLINKVKRPVTVPFLIQTAQLIHYWHMNRENKVYETLIYNFFTSLLSIYTNQLQSEVTQCSISEILNNQINFVDILLNPNVFTPKNKQVMFAEEKAEDSKILTVESKKYYIPEMLTFVRNLVVIYFKNTINREMKSFISALRKLIYLFDAKMVFEEMVAGVNESTCFKLFSSYFSKWLMNDNMKCEEIMDLSLILLKYVRYDEVEYIFDEFCGTLFNDTSVFYFFCKALSSYLENEDVLQWVKSNNFTKSILRLVDRFAEKHLENSKAKDIIITLFKAKCKTGEPIIDLSVAGRVINSISQNLEKPSEKSHMIELSQDLILNAEREQLNHPSFATLVSSLFTLCCSKSENEKLIKACKTGLEIIVPFLSSQNSSENFTKRLSESVSDIIINDKVEYSLDHIIANINTYVEVAVGANLKNRSCTNAEIKQAVEIIKVFLEKNLVRDAWHEESQKMLEKCCRVGYESIENFDFEYLEMEKYFDIPNNKYSTTWESYPNFDLNLILKYTKWSTYAGRMLNLIAEAHPRAYKTSVLKTDLRAYQVVKTIENSESEKPLEVENVVPIKISQEELDKLKNDLKELESKYGGSEYEEVNTLTDLLEHIHDYLKSVAFLDSFNKYYISMKHCQELKTLMRTAKHSAVHLLLNVNFVEFQSIYDYVRTEVRNSSIWWILKSFFRRVFNRNFIDGDENVVNTSAAIETQWDVFKKLKISKLPIHRGNYFKILYFIDERFDYRIPEEHWDDIFVYVHQFFEDFIEKTKFSESDWLSISAVSRLYLKMSSLIKKSEVEESMEVKIPRLSCQAWNEVVLPEIKAIDLWKKLAKEYRDNNDIPLHWLLAFQNLSDVVVDCLSTRKVEKIKESLEWAVEFGQLMTSHLSVIQITSFHVCLSTVPHLVKLDAEVFGNNMSQMFQNEKESHSSKTSTNDNWTIKNLQKEISHNQGIVEILLSDFIVGDCCTVQPFTDSFTYTYSYLLFWCFLLNACGEAHSSLRMQYGNWLQDAGHISTLLESVFKLMPQAVLHVSEVREDYQKYFESHGPLSFREPPQSRDIEQLACYIYRLFVQRLPNFVREWWNQTENKTSNLVEKVTKLYVSPILISNELKNAQQDKNSAFDNMEVKAYFNSREVIATYTIDDVKMDLLMTLPPNYPLGTAKVESSNVVVGTSNWRNLLFQICKYLIHQNGTIWDALVIWKNNLDKKFEGVEECYICFSILLGSSFEIPRLCCNTCKKKFHSNCLYKWFSTSNNSTCPICRNLF